MVPQERRADACKLSRFHISIKAQTVQSTLARIRASAPPAHHKAAEASKWSTQPNADVLSPVVVRRANTSRTGSFPGSQACGLAPLAYAHGASTRYRARLTALPAGMSGTNAPLRLSTASVPIRVHFLQKNVRIQAACPRPPA